jgi:hypothetical protein
MKVPATGSFESMDDFVNKVKTITPDYYQEVTRIINRHLKEFVDEFGRKPNLADIGGAGVFPFDITIPNKICIIDIFQKPHHIILPDNAEWVIQNILDEKISRNEKYDIVIMSGLLHHLADKRNNIRRNLTLCLKNVKNLLALRGCCLIFESICPPYFDTLQDLLFPIYSRILKGVLKFPYARLLSLKEITDALNSMNYHYSMLDFKQIKQHYCAGYKVSSKIYPIRYICVAYYT